LPLRPAILLAWLHLRALSGSRPVARVGRAAAADDATGTVARWVMPATAIVALRLHSIGPGPGPAGRAADHFGDARMRPPRRPPDAHAASPTCRCGRT
jgi:hypothetical protein